mgnify:FL=1
MFQLLLIEIYLLHRQLLLKAQRSTLVKDRHCWKLFITEILVKVLEICSNVLQFGVMDALRCSDQPCCILLSISERLPN